MTNVAILTFDPMMFDACTVMLYIAEATVRVRTDPAFLEVMATITAWTYGIANSKIAQAQPAHALRSGGSTTNAIRTGKHHHCEKVA